jgi:cytochrome c biogenesis protein CcmG/thiol:disulfide interchange protein DsbE
MAEEMPERSSRRWRLAAAVVVPVAVLGVLWAVSSTGADPAWSVRTEPGVPIAQSRSAPRVTAPLLRGSGGLAIGGEAGSVQVVNFWASWCRACRLEASDLQRLWSSYRDRGVRFVGVDYEDRSGAALAAARSFGMPYPSVRDPDGSVGDAFGIVGLPMTYVIGPDNHIRWLVVGRVHASSLGAVLDSMLIPGQEGSQT